VTQKSPDDLIIRARGLANFPRLLRPESSERSDPTVIRVPKQPRVRAQSSRVRLRRDGLSLDLRSNAFSRFNRGSALDDLVFRRGLQYCEA
jgi:hypothetical protein